MKVLIVFNHPAPYKVDVFNELNKYVDLTVLFERKKAKDRPDDFYNKNKINFKVTFNKHGYFGNENSYSLETKRYIKKHHKEFDLIIMNGYSKLSEMFAISYLSRHKIRFGLLINGGIINQNESSIKRKIKTHYIKKADYFISPSKKSNEYLIYYGANDKKIYNYPYSSLLNRNLLENPLSEVEKQKGKIEYGLPTHKVFVCPGQFIKRKNNIQLITLFKDIEDASLLLIGEGIEEENYRKCIKDNNIDNVIIKGFMPKHKLFDLMKYCDGLISLSNYDIYGHTLLEGMALGLIPISSKNIISSYEIIKNGENGYVLNNNTDLKEVINNIDYSIEKNCIITASRYTIEKCALTFNDIFMEILK